MLAQVANGSGDRLLRVYIGCFRCHRQLFYDWDLTRDGWNCKTCRCGTVPVRIEKQVER